MWGGLKPALLLLAGLCAAAAPQAVFYLVDIGHGKVAFVVSSAGGYAQNRKHSLVIQHHDTNFHEVLSGSRLNSFCAGT
jgi:hypothetical protein